MRAPLKTLVLLSVLLTSATASAQAMRFQSGGGTFTGGTLTSPLVLDADETLCSAALSLSYAGDDDLGLQRAAANTLNFCISGAAALQLSTVATFTVGAVFSGITTDIATVNNQDLTITPDGTGEVIFGTEVQFADGSAAAPTVVWDSDDDSGWYWNGSSGATAYSTNGTRTWIVSTSIASPTNGGANITSGAGACATPIYSAAGDLDSGPCRIGADDWGIAASSVAKFHVNSTATAVSTSAVALATQEARVGGIVETNITAVGNVGAGTDDLMTFALAAATLATDMQTISFEAWGTFAANGNNKTLTAAFGATTLISSGAIAANTGDWRINCTIIRTGATTQESSCMLITSNALLPVTTDFTAPGETLANSITLKLTGTATDDNDIVQEGWRVFYHPNN